MGLIVNIENIRGRSSLHIFEVSVCIPQNELPLCSLSPVMFQFCSCCKYMMPTLPTIHLDSIYGTLQTLQTCCATIGWCSRKGRWEVSWSATSVVKVGFGLGTKTTKGKRKDRFIKNWAIRTVRFSNKKCTHTLPLPSQLGLCTLNLLPNGLKPKHVRHTALLCVAAG